MSRRRSRGQPAAPAPVAIVIRPCLTCRNATDADGRCAACRLVLADRHGNEPVRTCPIGHGRTVDADGWCDQQRCPPPWRGARYHVAGPRLERDGAVYLEREVPVPMPKETVLRQVRALGQRLGRMPTVTPAEGEAAAHGDAWEPPEAFEAVGRRVLAARGRG